MKRQHIIEKLVAANYCSPTLLNGLTNDRLNNLYHHVWPRIVMMTARDKRRRERLIAIRDARKDFERWHAEWRRNWVHPRVKYPLTGPGRIEERPRLDFGVEDLRETASWMAHHKGGNAMEEALATLRVLAGRPKEEPYDIRRNRKSRNSRGRFRRTHGAIIPGQNQEGHARVG